MATRIETGQLLKIVKTAQDVAINPFTSGVIDLHGISRKIAHRNELFSLLKPFFSPNQTNGHKPK